MVLGETDLHPGAQANGKPFHPAAVRAENGGHGYPYGDVPIRMRLENIPGSKLRTEYADITYQRTNLHAQGNVFSQARSAVQESGFVAEHKRRYVPHGSMIVERAPGNGGNRPHSCRNEYGFPGRRLGAYSYGYVIYCSAIREKRSRKRIADEKEATQLGAMPLGEPIAFAVGRGFVRRVGDVVGYPLCMRGRGIQKKYEQNEPALPAHGNLRLTGICLHI